MIKFSFYLFVQIKNPMNIEEFIGKYFQRTLDHRIIWISKVGLHVIHEVVLFFMPVQSFIFWWEYMQQYLDNPIVQLLNTIRWPNKFMKQNQAPENFILDQFLLLSWTERKCKGRLIYGSQCFEKRKGVLMFKMCIVHFLSVEVTLYDLWNYKYES